MRVRRSRWRARQDFGRNGDVTDRTPSGRSVPSYPRLREVWTAVGGRSLLIRFGFVVLLVGGIAGYIFGRVIAHHDILEARALNQQLMSESQKLKAQSTEQNANFTALQAKLTSAQAALEAIVPSEHTYNISPNQSLIVADGRLTIALIGSPTNDGINLNINGKQQPVTAGDVVKVAVDSSTTCQVEVQSFDLFKALLTATCPPAKPQ
jgi:hypothetical protein